MNNAAPIGSSETTAIAASANAAYNCHFLKIFLFIISFCWRKAEVSIPKPFGSSCFQGSVRTQRSYFPYMEQAKGFEPSTFSLATRDSTTELHLRYSLWLLICSHTLPPPKSAECLSSFLLWNR